MLYDFDVDNNGDTVPDVDLRVPVQDDTRNRDTFLYNTGPIDVVDRQELERQADVLDHLGAATASRRVVGADIPVAPANIGPRSTPNYNQLATAGDHPPAGRGQGVRRTARRPVLRRPRLGLRPRSVCGPSTTAHVIPEPAEAGVDDLQGYNVHSIVLQVPKSRLVANGPDDRRLDRDVPPSGKVPEPSGNDADRLRTLRERVPPRHAARERGGHPAREEGLASTHRADR